MVVFAGAKVKGFGGLPPDRQIIFSNSCGQNNSELKIHYLVTD
jgi:hypothetical protein